MGSATHEFRCGRSNWVPTKPGGSASCVWWRRSSQMTPARAAAWLRTADPERRSASGDEAGDDPSDHVGSGRGRLNRRRGESGRIRRRKRGDRRRDRRGRGSGLSAGTCSGRRGGCSIGRTGGTGRDHRSQRRSSTDRGDPLEELPAGHPLGIEVSAERLLEVGRRFVAGFGHQGANPSDPGRSQPARSTYSGAWSDGSLPLRASRSRSAAVTRAATEREAYRWSMRIPRFLWKLPAR